MIVTASITLLALVCAALAYEVIKLKKRVDHATALADDIQAEFWPRLKDLAEQVSVLESAGATTVTRIDAAIARIDRAIEAHPVKRGGA